MLPIGNVHPNQLGYARIAADVLAADGATPVPGPATWAVLAAACLGTLGLARGGRRRRGVVAVAGGSAVR